MKVDFLVWQYLSHSAVVMPDFLVRVVSRALLSLMCEVWIGDSI